MPPSTANLGETVWSLPPLILHPFNERVPPSALLENSRASLILAGLVADEGPDREDLRRRILSGRYAEIRMLFFLGKDVFRWIDQCIESTAREPELQAVEIRKQTFAGLLTQGAPQTVKDKLVKWGVADYVSIFSRAIGLNVLFAAPPTFDILAEEFLRSYHRYTDSLYRSYIESEPHRVIGSRNFHFDLYASGEYSRMLESEWGTT